MISCFAPFVYNHNDFGDCLTQAIELGCSEEFPDLVKQDYVIAQMLYSRRVADHRVYSILESWQKLVR